MRSSTYIRPANMEEADALSRLAFRSKAYWGYSSTFMESCRDELSVPKENLGSKSFIYMVAERDGTIVGYYGLERLSDSVWELEALFVEPLYIGSGIGRLLMDHAKVSATEAGIEKIMVQGDPNAESFYRAAGGKPVGWRESKSIPGRYLPLFTIEC